MGADRRTRPLRAAAPSAEPGPPAAEAPAEHGAAEAAAGRSLLLGVVVALGVGLAATAIAFSIVAIPVFSLASTEPGSGLDRQLVRDGLFRVALPFGLLSGLVIGVLVGLWYRRGGRLPTDRTPLDL